MDTESLSAVVLAAGDSLRMRSARPKALHRLCGQPMVRYVVDTLGSLGVRRVVVVTGPGGNRVAKELQGLASVTDLADQVHRHGTGAALLAGMAACAEFDGDPDSGHEVLVVPADVPLVAPADLAELVTAHREATAAATLMTVREAGSAARSRHRVVRSGRDGRVVAVAGSSAPDAPVEATDDTVEVSTGIWCFQAALVAPAVRRVVPEGAMAEIDLHRVVEVLDGTGHLVVAHGHRGGREVVGIEDRVELAAVEAELRRRTNERWLERGVTMLDPARTYVDASVELSADVTLYPGTILQGSTSIGEGCEIGPDTRLVDCRVGPGSRVEKTMGEAAVIAQHCHVGPFAVLRPGAQLAAATTTGPFYTADTDT